MRFSKARRKVLEDFARMVMNREKCLNGKNCPEAWPVPVPGVMDHGALTGLADDDHPQYLLASGARALTGHWDVGGFRIENLGAPLAVGDALRVGDFNEVLKAIQKHLGVFWFNNNWLPSGMIANGVTGSGSISWSDAYVSIWTGATSGSYAYVKKDAWGISGAYSWDNKRYFGVHVYFSTYSAQYIHVVTGFLNLAGSSTNTFRHIGFKLINGDLYGTVSDGTTEATLPLETLTTSVRRRLECVLDPGVECRFYVDGVNQGAIATNLPAGTIRANNMLYAYVYNTEAANKYFYIYESRTLQEE